MLLSEPGRHRRDQRLRAFLFVRRSRNGYGWRITGPLGDVVNPASLNRRSDEFLESIKKGVETPRGVDLDKELRRSAPPTVDERRILFNQTA